MAVVCDPVDGRSLPWSKTILPGLAQLVPGQVVVLRLAGGRPEPRLGIGVVDAEFLGQFLDLLRPAGESPQRGGRHAGDFEVIFLPVDAVAHLLKPIGESDAKGSLPVGRIPLQVAELAGFPLLFDAVPGGVEDEAVGVQLRIGDVIDRPAGEMHELPPGHVPRRPLGVLAALADAYLHLLLDVLHRLADRLAERFQEGFVLQERIEQRERLGDAPGEIVSHRAIVLAPRGEWPSRMRMLVLAQCVELLPGHITAQAQLPGCLASPPAEGLPSLGVIISRGVVLLGGMGR